MPQDIALRPRLTALWERIRTSFWFVPTLMCIGAAVLAQIMLGIDAWLSSSDLVQIGWIYGGSPEGARALLSTVASSAITVAGTTFSITIAALTLASSQFGPRLLRTFVRDTGNQAVLGTFVATHLYCLLVLRTIRGLEDLRVVPDLSVTVGVGLAVASLGVLIYFIHHVATAIRADRVVAAVSRDLDHTIARLFPSELGQSTPTEGGAELPADFAEQACPIHAPRDGYVQVVDEESIFSLATNQDLLLRLVQRPGCFVVAGETLIMAYPIERISDELRTQLQATFVLGGERTGQQDTTFALHQLAEVAARALSPGINDPFTAMTCIDRLGAAICRLANQPLPDPRRYDKAGRLRIVADPLSFGDLLDAAFEQIRIYGRDNVIIMGHLLGAIEQIGRSTHDSERRALLADRVELLVEESDAALASAGDRRRLAEQASGALSALARPQLEVAQ